MINAWRLERTFSIFASKKFIKNIGSSVAGKQNQKLIRPKQK
jgi:hypothetical protein